ncbi:hypothetical protein M0802_008008 [Mischocyttarus mexicanus]|nr:hypothetical protein M0802_008008 [Mischocyttarus mexicanus]
MNGATTVGTSADLQHQQQQSQNETGSEHPRSPASPLSNRHDSGESSVISPGLPERYSPLGATGSTSSHDPYASRPVQECPDQAGKWKVIVGWRHVARVEWAHPNTGQQCRTA